MYVTGNSLIVEVARNSKNGGKYRIIAIESDRQLNLKKEFIDGEIHGFANDVESSDCDVIKAVEKSEEPKAEKPSKLSFQDFLKKYRK